MARVKAFLTGFVLLLAAAACGGGEPTIAAGDIARIMPSATDAPPATQLRTSGLGPQTLDEFVSDEAVRDRLRTLGFRLAYVASFATGDFPEDPSTAAVGATLYSASVVVVRDAEAAGRALRFYEERLKTRAKDLTPVIATQLGGDVFAFRFSALEGAQLPGLAYLWRVGNALFSVVGVGNPGPDPEATRRLADLINRRALA